MNRRWILNASPIIILSKISAVNLLTEYSDHSSLVTKLLFGYNLAHETLFRIRDL